MKFVEFLWMELMAFQPTVRERRLPFGFEGIAPPPYKFLIKTVQMPIKFIVGILADAASIQNDDICIIIGCHDSDVCISTIVYVNYFCANHRIDF